MLYGLALSGQYWLTDKKPLTFFKTNKIFLTIPEKILDSYLFWKNLGEKPREKLASGQSGHIWPVLENYRPLAIPVLEF